MSRAAIAAWFAVAAAACGDPSTSPDAPPAADARLGIDGAPITLIAIGHPEERPGTGDLTWVAVQDGDGPWRHVLGDGTGVYTITLEHPAYALAYACPRPDDEVDVRILYATTDELPTASMRCFGDPATVNVSGTATGVTPGTSVALWIGDRVTNFTAAQPTYSFHLPPATHDVLAVETDAVGPRRILALRGVEITADTTLDLDLTGAVATVASPWSSDIAGASIYARLWADRGGRAALFAQPSSSWWGAPSSILVGADIQVVRVQTADGLRHVNRYLREAAAIDAVFPAPLDAGAFAATIAAAAPHLRLRATGTGAAAAHLHVVDFGQVDRYWHVEITGARTPGGAIDVTMPDLFGVDGFDPAWGLRDAVDGYASLASYDSNRQVDALQLMTMEGQHDPPPPGLDGLEIRVSRISQTLDLTP